MNWGPWFSRQRGTVPPAPKRHVRPSQFHLVMVCYCLTSVATEICGQLMLRKLRMIVCVY